MNFFEHQANARRMTSRLLLLFGLAVAGIVVAVNGGVLLLFGGSRAMSGATRQADAGGGSLLQTMFGLHGDNIALLLVTSVLTIGAIAAGSLWRIASLRGGGDAVAMQMGGTAVPENTTDPDLRRLRNVVDEMAIASGVPVPRVYVLEQEPGINAFAAGYAPADAAVAVTRGALDRLNRDELQGVIAHEFSHVLNGDMRLNIRLMGILFGIMMVAVMAREILQAQPLLRGYRHGARGRGGQGSVVLIALVFMVCGYMGLFFARWIKAGVSRSREFLADASAVQFTRQTRGLAGALKKVAGLPDGARLEQQAKAEEVSHMLFGDGLGFSGMFATHPPLLERIRKLEPGFDAAGLDRLRAEWALQPPVGLDEDLAMGLHAAPSVPQPAQPAQAARPPLLPAADAVFALTPPMVVQQVAHPGDDDYLRAGAIVARLPDPLRAHAADRDAVMPLLLGLLLVDAAPVLANQRSEIVSRLGQAMADRAEALWRQHLQDLHPALRLPLASLAFPLLRLRPRPQVDAFLDTVYAVVHTDARITLSEYCLARLLEVHVRESLEPGRHVRFARLALDRAGDAIAGLLAVVAQAGHPDPEQARAAYLAGMQRVLPREHRPFVVPSDAIQTLDAAWEPLDALKPMAKELLVEALTATIAHDGRVNVVEAELLRTICATLHCPLPPVLDKA